MLFRFYPLFGLSKPDDVNTVLKLVLNYLKDENLNSRDFESVGQILYNLISLADHEASEGCGNSLEIPSDLIIRQIDSADCNLGKKFRSCFIRKSHMNMFLIKNRTEKS